MTEATVTCNYSPTCKPNQDCTKCQQLKNMKITIHNNNTALSQKP